MLPMCKVYSVCATYRNYDARQLSQAIFVRVLNLKVHFRLFFNETNIKMHLGADLIGF